MSASAKKPKPAAATGFDINRSTISDDALAKFLKADLSEDLQSIPGIGPKAVENLGKEIAGDSAIHSAYQLVGKYLTLRAPGMTSQQHKDAFWHYLSARGVASHRSGVVHCIAEKVALMIPALGKVD